MAICKNSSRWSLCLFWKSILEHQLEALHYKMNADIHSETMLLWIQGTRRVVALTGWEATEAIRLADELAEKLRSLDALSGPSLESHTTAFKTVRLP